MQGATNPLPGDRGLPEISAGNQDFKSVARRALSNIRFQ